MTTNFSPHDEHKNSTNSERFGNIYFNKLPVPCAAGKLKGNKSIYFIHVFLFLLCSLSIFYLSNGNKILNFLPFAYLIDSVSPMKLV